VRMMGFVLRTLGPRVDIHLIRATPLREKSTQVLQLTEENKKLEDELQRMNERLKAAERKSEALQKSTTA
jgi:hypothetical protein